MPLEASRISLVVVAITPPQKVSPWALAWHIIIKQCQDTGLPEEGKSDCERRQTLADTKQPSGFYTMAVGLFIFLW